MDQLFACDRSNIQLPIEPYPILPYMLARSCSAIYPLSPGPVLASPSFRPLLPLRDLQVDPSMLHHGREWSVEDMHGMQPLSPLAASGQVADHLYFAFILVRLFRGMHPSSSMG